MIAAVVEILLTTTLVFFLIIGAVLCVIFFDIMTDISKGINPVYLFIGLIPFSTYLYLLSFLIRWDDTTIINSTANYISHTLRMG